jgi:hypothetical protein
VWPREWVKAGRGNQTHALPKPAVAAALTVKHVPLSTAYVKPVRTSIRVHSTDPFHSTCISSGANPAPAGRRGVPLRRGAPLREDRAGVMPLTHVAEVSMMRNDRLAGQGTPDMTCQM